MASTHSTQWSSTQSFIMAATGAAVGLGNIWKFPYMAGKNGGSAFVLLYLLCILFIGLPLMTAEIVLGRLGRKNPIDSLKKLAKEHQASTAWSLTGWIGALALLLVLAFYSVISGWVLAYFFKIISGEQNHFSAHSIQQEWSLFLKTPVELLFWHTVFILMTLGVVALGVIQGIERASNLMMPGLFAILLILALYACVTGDFQQAWHFLFHFQYTELNRTVLVDALGHAFFSLALGAGCMLAYGTYLPPRTSIVHSVCIIAALDVLVAILSGLAIFPIVFQYHLPPDAGPDLMFKTLPIAFAQMPGGFLIGGLFFILLTFAAWTSSISLAEPLVMIGIERLKWTRIKACMIVGAMAWVLGIGCVLSFNYWAAFKPLAYCGIQGNYFDVITDFTTNLLLPLGGILFAIFTGWKLNPEILQETLALQLNHFKIWYFLIRYLVPIGIGIILIHGVL